MTAVESPEGRTSVSDSWTGGGTNATRLSNWLAPGVGSPPQTLDGISAPYITGPNEICSSGSFTVFNGPPGFTWNKSANLTITSSTSSYVSVSAISPGSSWVSIMLGSTELIRYNFQVCYGAPVITGFDGPENVSTYSTYYYGVNLYSYSDPISYSWNLSGGSGYLDPNGSSASVNFYNPTSYYLSVYVSNACGSDYAYKYIYAGYSPSPASTYPNPVNDILNIEIDNQAAKQQPNVINSYNIRLYDVLGNIRRQTTTQNSSIQFNVSNLPNGFYYLHIYDGVSSKPDMRTIVVQH
jgi:hypothetical protein